jgi:hypothetical protein
MLFTFLLWAAQVPPPNAVPHLWWAQRMVADIKPENNRYGSRPTQLEWRGANGATTTVNRTVCSSFITGLLKKAYEYGPEVMKRWLDTPTPNAARYHQAITSANQFDLITQIQKIKPGDIIAIRYSQLGVSRERGSSSSGHTMLVASQPIPQPYRAKQRGMAFVSTSKQYRVSVIDSSRSGHGMLDTRLLPTGGWGQGGVGLGTIILETNPTGNILGYRWSDRLESPLRRQSDHSLVVGRFCGLNCGPHPRSNDATSD